MIRAYGGTAALCLREAEKIALVETVSGTIACTFGDLALVQARLGAFPGMQVRDQAFTDIGAVLSLLAPATELDGLTRLITELTSGRVTPRWGK